MSEPSQIDAIRQHATRIGFDRLGVCRPDPGEEADLFRSWLARGLHGEMAWLARSADRRLDPSLLMREIRSILVGAVRYAPRPSPPISTLSGEVSCYAWGEDYHRVVGARASALAAFLRATFGARAAEYVDTGPVLERLWAAKAGVGWVGRNALILDRDLGSYLFLAVVLTDLDLPPDPPAVDRCGACSLCLEACPTQAIVEPRIVDSRRCLSYHTIELRGIFPEEFRESLGARVFGCDECQTVCPWNRDASDPPSEFLPRESSASPDLPGLLLMTLPEYTGRFRGSAMKRATYQGLRRNAAVALGNLLAGLAAGDQSRPPLAPEDRARAVAALRTAAEDPDPSVAEAAARAIERSAAGK